METLATYVRLLARKVMAGDYLKLTKDQIETLKKTHPVIMNLSDRSIIEVKAQEIEGGKIGLAFETKYAYVGKQQLRKLIDNVDGLGVTVFAVNYSKKEFEELLEEKT